MLDFYCIDDNEAKPGYPEKGGLQFAGGLDYRTFSNLQQKEIMDKRFDYYSDFRLTTVFIQQIRKDIVQRNLQTDTDVKKLIQLFDIADEKQSGLIAYAD